jgi:hypothetical protein
LVGSALDSVKETVKESAPGKLLQTFRVFEGEESERLREKQNMRLRARAKSLEDQQTLESIQNQEEIESLIQKKKELGEIQSAEEEQLERVRLLKETRDKQIDEWNKTFDKQKRLIVGIQENEFLDKFLELLQSSQDKVANIPDRPSLTTVQSKPLLSQDTYTEDEEEKLDRQSSSILSKILLEEEERNRLFFSLSDPRGKELNIRWPEDMSMISGGTSKGSTKEGGGLLSGLLGGLTKGIGGIFSTLASSVGVASIGSIVATVLAGGAIGATVGTLIHQYGPDWLPFTKSSWDKFKKDQFEDAKKRSEHQHKQITEKREKLEKETGMKKGDYSKLRGLAFMADTDEGKEEFQAELQKLSKKQQESFLEVEASRLAARKDDLARAKEDAGWYTSDADQKAIDEAQAEVDRQNERIQNIMKNMGESDIQVEKTVNNNVNNSTKVSSDSTTKAVRDLQQSMEKIMEKSMNRLESNESSQFATRLSMETLQSPMTLPDSVLSQPPQAQEQMGTIPT